MPYPTKKLGEATEDKSKDARTLFSILTGRNTHIITIIIVGHLLAEYLLDKIITAKIKNRESGMKKNFGKKLKFLYPTWLPLFIYKNIKLLNKARNEVAHNLGEIYYEPLIYLDGGGKRIVKIPKRKNKDKLYFRELINTTLFDLVNYSFYTLNTPDDLDLDIIFYQKK